MAVTDIRRMFLPWSERTKLVYYNDKDCGLKQAYEALEGGDAEGAFRLSEQNLETCKKAPDAKDKVLGHAYYNVGMSYMMQSEHGKALEYFEQAARHRPGDVVKQAMSDCRKARELTLAMQQIEDKAAFDADRQRAEGEKAAQAEIATTLSNADVIQMVQSKLPDSIIIHKIKTSTCSFDTSPDALVALANAGVSQEVIIAMMGP